ncbi:MAG: site-specific integrase [Rhodocyclaceae bacterium]
MGGKRERTGVVAISKSSIQISFTFRGVACRERIKLEPTPTNLRRAANHRSAILDAIERGTFDYAATFPDSPKRFLFAEQKGEGVPLETYLEPWIARQKALLKASTWTGYRRIVENVLIPTWGKKALTDIRRPDIRQWCEEQTCTNKRLANVQSVLRQALQDALDDELIDANPLYGWKFARKEAPKPTDDIDPFSADEQRAIVDACRHDQVRNLFQFAFWSGLRTSELVALEWGDVDWRRGLVRVSRAQTQAADEAEVTKTRRSTRDVKLLAPALEALQAQKAHTFMAGGRVFHDPRYNTPWDGDQPIRGMWIPALRLAGVRYRNPYQTRHTYASMMLTAGENPVWVANQMGHSDTTMIFRNYGRWIPDASPLAGGKAVEMFAGARGASETAIAPNGSAIT